MVFELLKRCNKYDIKTLSVGFRKLTPYVNSLAEVNVIFHIFFSDSVCLSEKIHALGLWCEYSLMLLMNLYSNMLYRANEPWLLFSWLRFGVWEAAKWVARVRDLSIYDPKRPILLNLTTDLVEENRYLQSKESALEATFLIKMMES